MDLGKIRAVRTEDFPLDEVSSKYAQEISSLTGVERIILLPDCFTKEKYIGLDYKITIPSSSVIVTDEDSLYPQFRSRGINCGMLVAALPFKKDDIPDMIIQSILNAFTYGPLYYLSYRSRLPYIPSKYDLTHNDFLRVISEGVSYLASRYDYGEETVQSFDFNGSFEKVDLNSVQHLLNHDWLHKRTIRMRHAFGRYYGGNHFLEVQYAQTASPSLGLEKGQVVIMFHTGCQGIDPVLRSDLSAAYIKKPKYIRATKDDEVYEAFFTAQTLLMNLGQAYRLAAVAILNDVLKESGFGRSRIIMEKSHNFVQKVQDKGQPKLLYRHNAEALQAGEFGIVSGRYDSSSYIVKGGDKISEIYNTIDHGLGKIIDASESVRKMDTCLHTDLYRFHNGMRLLRRQTRRVGHIEQKAARAYFDLMSANEYCVPEVELVPFANLKYT